MNKFKDLKVWQQSVELATEVCRLTKTFPHEEKFGLVSQINRCAVSIPSNIAEGSGRYSKKEFCNFLGFANGSSYELETQLLIAFKLNYLSEGDYERLVTKNGEVQKMIFG